MKNFKEYLSESKRQWTFRIKVAGNFDQERAKTMEALLGKFQVSKFKKVGVTPIQELPLDFPKIRNAEVSIFETVVDYPSTQMELHEYLCTSMGITKDALVVRSPNEPSEQYQVPTEPREEPLLTDSEYKEVENANFDDYYGDKYNTNFLKELNDVLRLQRRERNEQIPSEAVARYNTDDKSNNKSPIKQAQEVRKNI